MPYKLSEEIRRFVVEQKQQNPALSCRGIVLVVKKHFNVSLSKSLINCVIKEQMLSSPVGRRRTKKASKTVPHAGFIDNGGLYFLKIADVKLSLVPLLTEHLSIYLPSIPRDGVQLAIEALIFQRFFDNNDNLGLFMGFGQKIALDKIEHYISQLSKIPFFELNKVFSKLGIIHNINKINRLDAVCLTKLHSCAQASFFPSSYRFLDFIAMKERFYSLWAKAEKSDKTLKIRFYSLPDFHWTKDSVWQKDFAYAVRRVNEAQLLTRQQELIGVDSQVGSFPATPINAI